jgi:HPt (histidine-containing phosphotransfer) domain-containing protein
MRVYLEDTPKSLALLDLAVKNDNIDALIAPAHSLKSTSANLGATHLSELAKRLEQGARSNTLPMAPAVMVAQLVAEYQRVRTEFRRLLTPQR